MMMPSCLLWRHSAQCWRWHRPAVSLSGFIWFLFFHRCLLDTRTSNHTAPLAAACQAHCTGELRLIYSPLLFLFFPLDLFPSSISLFFLLILPHLLFFFFFNIVFCVISLFVQLFIFPCRYVMGRRLLIWHVHHSSGHLADGVVYCPWNGCDKPHGAVPICSSHAHKHTCALKHSYLTVALSCTFEC